MDTGWKSPTSTGRENNNWTNPTNAYSSDVTYASAVCTVSQNKFQSYENFDFGIPSNSVITGIAVKMKHYETDNTTEVFRLRILNTTGSGVWTSPYKDVTLSLSDTTEDIGGDADLWNNSWTYEDFTDANFSVGFFWGNTPSSQTAYVDLIQVKVFYYTVSTSPSVSPSISLSTSPSKSPSVSPSKSPSSSPSVSPSPSKSPSVSRSLSPSSSISPSRSPSASPSFSLSASPSLSPSVSPSVSPSPIAGFQVLIGGVERKRFVDLDSLEIENILTRQVDRCTFTIKSYGTQTFQPTIGEEVVIIYNSYAERIFAGNIVKVEQKSKDYKIIEFDVECNDFGRQLDRYLINDSFEDQTIAQIINTILADKNLDDAGFSDASVSCSIQLGFIAFKYEPFSNVLTQLADLVNYDWYVDPYKVIHFFAKDSSVAPFNLYDDDGSYIFDSLTIRRDNSQVKNVVYVRGGEYLGSVFTTDYISDGIQNVYPLGYKYDEIRVNVTGSVWEGGVDGIDAITTKDYIWNKEEKFVRFRGDRVPNNASAISISGQPYLPVLVKLRDAPSIATMKALEGGTGEYEAVILDNTINSKEGARDRARAELTSYKDTLSEAEFETYVSGLKAGQYININSVAHNINENYIINRVVTRPWTSLEAKFSISLVTTKTSGIIDFLRNLIISERKKIVISENEILDTIDSIDESISISELVSANLSDSQNLQNEAIAVGESVTIQALDYAIVFVAGDFPPSGTSRVALADGSYL